MLTSSLSPTSISRFGWEETGHVGDPESEPGKGARTMLEREFYAHGTVDSGLGVEGGALDGLVQEISQFDPGCHMAGEGVIGLEAQVLVAGDGALGVELAPDVDGGTHFEPVGPLVEEVTGGPKTLSSAAVSLLGLGV